MFYKHECGCIVLKESADSEYEILVKDCNGEFLFLRQIVENYPTHNRSVSKIIAEVERKSVFDGINSLIRDGLKFRELKELIGNK